MEALWNFGLTKLLSIEGSVGYFVGTGKLKMLRAMQSMKTMACEVSKGSKYYGHLSDILN